MRAVQHGHRVLYRGSFEALEELAQDATDQQKKRRHLLMNVPFLILDNLGFRGLPPAAVEDFGEMLVRRHGRASTMIASCRPLEDWNSVIPDPVACAATVHRLRQAHVVLCGPHLARCDGRKA